mmetsp:Transcript_23158/g.28415  ORF Transcript_23158/g.28415 Transcript_23158/m.28415 type:complete len:84 (+) Transcript_23158:81-332(+)
MGRDCYDSELYFSDRNGGAAASNTAPQDISPELWRQKMNTMSAENSNLSLVNPPVEREIIVRTRMRSGSVSSTRTVAAPVNPY